MQRSFLLSAAMLLCCPAVHATAPAPALRADSIQFKATHSQRMAALAPSLRQWVLEEGRRSADSSSSVEAVGEAVRTRLSGQNYSNADVEVLVQLVLTEAVRQAEADLRDVLEEMKAVNARKKAQREAARAAAQAQQGEKEALRDSYEQRTQLPPESATGVKKGSASESRAFAPPQDRVDSLQESKDSLSEQSEETQLKMQMYMDRMTKADSARSEAMKKFSETASTIIGNLK